MRGGKTLIMLNRRHIRAKTMQELYAMERADEQDLEKSVKRLDQNLHNIYKLYILLLDLLVQIKRAEEDLIERRKKKFFKNEEDEHPNLKMVKNQVLNILENNYALRDAVEKYKSEKIWDFEKEIVLHLLEKIKNSPYYKEYMSSEKDDFETDKQFLLDIYKNVIAPDEKLRESLEDKEINWADDMAIANTMVMKTLGEISINQSPGKPLPPLFKKEDDARFGHDLLIRTWQNAGQLKEMIAEKTINWDLERLSNIDRLLMMMALAEFLYFPEIPETATINEYVEIAKEYSQPKSRKFINGILDRLYKELNEKKLINKIQQSKK